MTWCWPCRCLGRSVLPTLLPVVFIVVCGYAGAVIAGTDWDLRPARPLGVLGALVGAVLALVVVTYVEAFLERGAAAATTHRHTTQHQPTKLRERTARVRRVCVTTRLDAENVRPAVAVHAREVEGGVGDGGVGPVDDPRQRPAELEDVLGAEVGVGDHALTRTRRTARAHDVDEVARTAEVLEPLAQVGGFGRDEVLHRRRVDRMQLAQKASESTAGAGGGDVRSGRGWRFATELCSH